jgi:hypothetical protein
MTGLQQLLDEARTVEVQLKWMATQVVGLAQWAGSVRRQLEEIQAVVDAAEDTAYDRVRDAYYEDSGSST